MVQRTDSQVSWVLLDCGGGWMSGLAPDTQSRSADGSIRRDPGALGTGWPSQSLLFRGSEHPLLCWDSAELLLSRKLQTVPEGTCSVPARSAPAQVPSPALALLTQKLV